MDFRTVLVFLVVFSSFTFISTSNEFDFFYFTLMWPGAYCTQTNAGCCLPTHGTVPESDFFVSGLQTYNATSRKSISKCTNTTFNLNDLNTLAPEIYQYWSSIKCPSNNGKSYWRSYWRLNGVCSGLSEVDYFQAALNLRAKIDPLALLAKKGINPTYDMYSVSDIKSAIAEGIGATPSIQCSKGAFDKYQLYQIHVCVAKDASTIIDCPYEQKFNCGEGDILFHPFRTWMMVEKTQIIKMPIYA